MNEKIKELFRKEWTFSQSNKIKDIIASFSIGERVAFYVLVGVFVLSSLTLLFQVNENFLVAIPTRGGTLTEGVIGTPRFVNPLLATSDADKDLSALIYSGLLKEDGSGNLVPDLAESYTISNDGLTYTFVLKNNAKFQDGTKVTADDVVFTINKLQDPALKSPRALAWNSVTVAKVNDTTVTFTLNQPYAPFIYNTTLGILPKHIWNEVSNDSFPFSTLNIKPVGSGPYAVTKVTTDSSGLPTEYDLKANSTYTSGEPYITNIIFKFYQNENSLIYAYGNKDVNEINSISPENMSSIKRTDGTTLQIVQERIFGIFFNQNQNPVLVNKEVRQALDVAIDKQALINTVLHGYGRAIDGPLPTDDDTSPAMTPDQRISTARAILEKAGWTQGSDGIYVKIDKKTKKVTDTLALSLSTSDAPELKAEAEMIQADWTAIGAQVDVKIFEIGDLNQNIIRPRKYDALLFGEIVPAGNDLYPFWHSSQRNDPGLNISMYANVKTDKILESLRTTSDPDEQISLEKSFETQIQADDPAVFLYAPDFIYVVPKNIQNMKLETVTEANDRFNTISSWYTETTKVWQMFVSK
jgi:peptide/nickel transport system substrate-binding protein